MFLAWASEKQETNKYKRKTTKISAILEQSFSSTVIAGGGLKHGSTNEVGFRHTRKTGLLSDLEAWTANAQHDEEIKSGQCEQE